MKNTKLVVSLMILLILVLWVILFSLFTQSTIPLQRPWVLIDVVLAGEPVFKLILSVTGVASMFLVLGIAFRFFRQYQRFDLHGEARFASYREVCKYGLVKAQIGINLGFYIRFGMAKTLLKYDFKKDPGHVCLIAPTRSQKGVAFVIPTALTYPDSIIALDVKGEIYDATSGFRAKCGQKVLRYAPLDNEGNTCSFNPIALINKNDHHRITKISEIAFALYPDDKNTGSTNQFFQVSARSLFSTIVMFLMDTTPDGEPSPCIPDVLDFVLSTSDLQDHIKTNILPAYWNFLDPYCKQGFNDFLQRKGNELSGVLSTLKTGLAVFQNPIVAMSTRGNDIDFSVLRKSRQSIYFVCPPKKIELLSPLIRMMFDQALSYLQEEVPKVGEHSVLFLMDELTRFGKLNSIKEGISDVAGYNIMFFSVFQNFGQIVDIYGQSGADTYLANSKYRIFYAPNEPNTAELLSKMLGVKTSKNKSVSKSRSGTSISTSETKRELMNTAELQLYDRSKAIILGESQRPIEVKKMLYYKVDGLKERVLPPHQGAMLDVESMMKAYKDKHIPMPTFDDDDIDDERLSSTIDELINMDD